MCAIFCLNNIDIHRPQSVTFTGKRPPLNLQRVGETLYHDYFARQISPFDNPIMYQYLAKDSKKLESLLKKLYKDKLVQYDKMLVENNVAKKHRVLLVDPGVTSHIDEFIRFVNEKKIDTTKITPFNLRRSFSEYLGTETVYRGLNSPEYDILIPELKEKGIYPQYREKQDEVLNSINYYLSTKAKPVWNVFSKIRDVIRGKHNEFMPVSSIYDIAASVPKDLGTSKSPVVVVKTEVPRISVIKQKGYFEQRFPSYVEKIFVGDKQYQYATQRAEIEAFVPFHIPTKKAEYTVDTHTPDYKWN